MTPNTLQPSVTTPFPARIRSLFRIVPGGEAQDDLARAYEALLRLPAWQRLR